MTKMIFVNLPVANVEKSVAFYQAIGFTKDERFSQPGSAAAMTWSDSIFFTRRTPSKPAGNVAAVRTVQGAEEKSGKPIARMPACATF